MLEIELLGTFEAKRDGVPIDGLKSRRANRLLALLVLESNRSVHRQWIEMVLETTYDGLRQAESALRSALGDEKWRIKASNNSLFLDVTDVHVDVLEFEQLIAKQDKDSLQKAIRIYRGGLLKDWDGAWIVSRREELQESYLDALQQIVRIAVQGEDYEKAITLLRRFTQTFPRMDSGWAQLIEVYFLANQRDNAQTAYQGYMQALEDRAADERRVLTPSRRIAAIIGRHSQPLENGSSRIAGELIAGELVADSAALTTDVIALTSHFESVNGAVPLSSPYYISRIEDEIASHALAPQTSFILIKGPKQVGKSSLLARVLQQSRERSARVLYTAWQNTPQSEMVDASAFLAGVAARICDQLGLDVSPLEHFSVLRPPTRNFERFLLRQVFPAVDGWIVWGIDEADRLFECPFKDDIFGMMRSWHNERSLDPDAPWQRLTVVLSYATDAYLIHNINQSPFNVGYPIELTDFTISQVSELNRLHGEPLKTREDLMKLFAFVGGHPYLLRRSFLEIGLKQCDVAAIESEGRSTRGFFRDHLEQLRLSLLRDTELTEALKRWLHDGVKPRPESFVRLHAAGIVRGDDAVDMQIRCQLYADYLKKALQ